MVSFELRHRKCGSDSNGSGVEDVEDSVVGDPTVTRSSKATSVVVPSSRATVYFVEMDGFVVLVSAAVWTSGEDGRGIF